MQKKTSQNKRPAEVRKGKVEKTARSTPAAALTYLPPAFLAFIAHRRSLGLGLLSDDWGFWSKASSLWDSIAAMSTMGGRFVRPAPALLWWLDRLVWDKNAAGFHLTNLILLCLCVMSLVRLARELGLSRLAAAGGGALLAVHFAGVGSVAWCSSRFDLVCLLFSLLSLIFYARGGALAAAALFFAALLAKEMAITLPAVFMALSARDWAEGKKRRGLFGLGIIGTALILYLVSRFILLGGVGGYRVGGASLSTAEPAGFLLKTWLVYPANRLMAFSIPARVVWSALILIGLASRETRRKVALALAMVWVSAVPVVPILPHDSPVMNDRLLLFPLACLALAGAFCVPFSGRIKWAALILVLAAGVMSFMPSGKLYADWQKASRSSAELISALEPMMAHISPGDGVYVGGLPGRESGVLVSGAGLAAALEEYQMKEFPGAKRSELVIETAGFDDDLALASIRADSFQVYLIWDPSARGFIDVSDRIRNALAKRDEIERSGSAIQKMELVDGGKTCLLQPERDIKGSCPSFQALGPDPVLVGPAMEISAWAVSRVTLTMSARPIEGRGGLTAKAELYWTGDSFPGFSESAKISIPIEMDGVAREYEFPLEDSISWLRTGKVTRIRLDPADRPSRIEIWGMAIEPI